MLSVCGALAPCARQRGLPLRDPEESGLAACGPARSSAEGAAAGGLGAALKRLRPWPSPRNGQTESGVGRQLKRIAGTIESLAVVVLKISARMVMASKLGCPQLGDIKAKYLPFLEIH